MVTIYYAIPEKSYPPKGIEAGKRYLVIKWFEDDPTNNGFYIDHPKQLHKVIYCLKRGCAFGRSWKIVQEAPLNWDVVT